MSLLRIVNIIVLVLGVVGGIYYTFTDDWGQGTVVVLLGILWFVSFPHIIDDHSH